MVARWVQLDGRIDRVIGAALGAVTAFATIRIAQKSERRLLDASDSDSYLTEGVV